MKSARTLLTVTFDVTHWTVEAIDALRLEAGVQGEANDEHPDAALESTIGAKEIDVDPIGDFHLMIGHDDDECEIWVYGSVALVNGVHEVVALVGDGYTATGPHVVTLEEVNQRIDLDYLREIVEEGKNK